MSNVLSIEEMYDQKESYVIGQLYLRNRHDVAYGKNSTMNTSICENHAKFYGKLFDEQEKRHSLVFHARLSSFNHNEVLQS